MKPQAATITVGVLDASDLMRESLAALFARTPDLVCVGTWQNPGEAMLALQRNQPDVLLVDSDLPTGLAFTLLNMLSCVGAATRVILMTDHEDVASSITNAVAPRSPFSLPDLRSVGAVRAVLSKRRAFRFLAAGVRNVAHAIVDAPADCLAQP